MIAWDRPNGWEIDDGPKHVLLQGHVTVFRLIEDTSGGFIRYKVDFDDGFMPESWRGAVFDVRGQSSLVWSENLLNPWSMTEKVNYNEAIGLVTQDASTDTLRLEAEITIDGKKAVIILLGSENAVKGSQDPTVLEPLMVVLKRVSLGSPQIGAAEFVEKPHREGHRIGMQQDGTAHAHQN
jgi:hypothetical protein